MSQQHSPFHRKHKEEENTEAWLMSYADMITLLLCFFIIFVAVSEPKKEKLEAIVSQGLGGKFGSLELASPFLGVFRSLQGVVESNQMGKEIAVERTVRGVEMEIAAKTFFQDGQADFRPDALSVLQELLTPIKSADFTNYMIAVEVHTDDVPVATPQYPSNWEFSSARASRLVRFFIEQGVEAKRLKATGYGSAHPKVPNIDLQGNPIPENRDRNQRIVLRMERVV